METFGRYQLQEKLGQGGMGVVYRAFDTVLERVVALKLVLTPEELDPEMRQRFFREARAAPRLSTFTFLAEGPFGTASLRDLQFQTASFWTTSGSVGLKANLAPRLLINFNLRFAIGNAGLTDRITPLLGVEWAF